MNNENIFPANNEENIKNENIFITPEKTETEKEKKDEFINNLPDWDLLPPLEGVERTEDDIL